MSNPITLCPPLRIIPCTTPVSPEVSATSTAPSSLVFSNYCEAGAYSHTRLCKVYHSLQISDLKKIVLTDLRFLLSDPQAVIVQKQDRLEAFRRADVRLNAFCIQAGTCFVEVRLRPPADDGESLACITHIEERLHDQPRVRYISVTAPIGGVNQTLKMRVPFGWQAEVGEVVAVKVFDEMPQRIATTYIHPVQVQSHASATIIQNTTEAEREAMTALEGVMGQFNHLVFESGREEFWLPTMSPEERKAFDQAFPDTEVDHPGGNHPLRYAGTIAVREGDPCLKHVPKNYKETAYSCTVGDRKVTYYAVPISHHPRYRHRIAKLADRIDQAGHRLPASSHFSEYLSRLAGFLRTGDVFGMTHYQLGYYAELGQKIQSGNFDPTVDSGVVFWMIWRGWRAAPFVHTFLGATVLQAANRAEEELGAPENTYQQAFQSSDRETLEHMTQAVGQTADSSTQRLTGTLIVVPQCSGAQLSYFPALGGVNMYTVMPEREEHHLNVIISDSLRAQSVATMMNMKSMFGDDVAEVSLEEVASLLELLVTRHERGHGNGAQFLNNNSPYKPALEEARADIIALRAEIDFVEANLLDERLRKAYRQIVLSKFLNRYLPLHQMKNTDGSWNQVLFGYGDESQPHAVGRTFIIRHLLDYVVEGQKALILATQEGRTTVKIPELNIFFKAADAFLLDVTQYLNAPTHEAGEGAWAKLTTPFSADCFPTSEHTSIQAIQASVFVPTLVRS